MSFQVNLIVPTHALASVEAEYLQIPSESGKMGVLANHAPLRCILAPGVVECRLPDKSTVFYSISSGLAVIQGNVATILADTAEAAETINAERAEAARDRALQRLQLDGEGTVNRARAEAALQRALARLDAARAVGKY